VKSGAASHGFNTAHAAVVKRPKQRERTRVDGFTGRVRLFPARLAAVHPTHNAPPIKSTLIDRKFAALRFVCALLRFQAPIGRAPGVERTAEALQQSKKPPETALDRLDVVSARIARASNRRGQ
jgi:hypothetical protein